ncbi:hypothetical protein D9M68_575640 [compost metagenome]
MTHITRLIAHFSTYSNAVSSTAGRNASRSALLSSATSNRNTTAVSQAATTVAQSMPPTPGMIRRSGRTSQSVIWNTPCETGLRVGSRVSCIQTRSSRAMPNKVKMVSSRKRAISVNIDAVSGGLGCLQPHRFCHSPASHRHIRGACLWRVQHAGAAL